MRRTAEVLLGDGGVVGLTYVPCLYKSRYARLLMHTEKANNQSGYIGAAIVGGFVAVVGSWYGVRYVWHRRRPEHVSK